MKLAVALFALTVVGCSQESVPSFPTAPAPPPATPTPPTPPPVANGWIWAMAVDHFGVCIAGATFEVVRGQGPVGEVITQQTPCDAWDYGGGVTLKQLTPGVQLTLRASAAGYTIVERSLIPNVQSGQAAIFELVKLLAAEAQ